MCPCPHLSCFYIHDHIPSMALDMHKLESIFRCASRHIYITATGNNGENGIFLLGYFLFSTLILVLKLLLSLQLCSSLQLWAFLFSSWFQPLLCTLRKCSLLLIRKKERSYKRKGHCRKKKKDFSTVFILSIFLLKIMACPQVLLYAFADFYHEFHFSSKKSIQTQVDMWICSWYEKKEGEN